VCCSADIAGHSLVRNSGANCLELLYPAFHAPQMLRSQSSACFANLSSLFRNLHFWSALVLKCFVSWLRLLFVVGCPSRYSPKLIFMASIQVGRRLWLSGVIASSVLVIAEK
jgi:hypothetical protein